MVHHKRFKRHRECRVVCDKVDVASDFRSAERSRCARTQARFTGQQYPSFLDDREIEADGCAERPRPDVRPGAILTGQDRVIFHRDRENVHFCMRKGGGTMA